MSKEWIKKCGNGHVMFPLCEIQAPGGYLGTDRNPLHLGQYVIFVCNACLTGEKVDFGHYWQNRMYGAEPAIPTFTFGEEVDFRDDCFGHQGWVFYAHGSGSHLSHLFAEEVVEVDKSILAKLLPKLNNPELLIEAVSQNTLSTFVANFEEKERKQIQEEARRKEKERRKSSGQCVMCGKRLGFFQRFRGEDRHNQCIEFR